MVLITQRTTWSISSPAYPALRFNRFYSESTLQSPRVTLARVTMHLHTTKQLLQTKALYIQPDHRVRNLVSNWMRQWHGKYGIWCFEEFVHHIAQRLFVFPIRQTEPFIFCWAKKQAGHNICWDYNYFNQWGFCETQALFWGRADGSAARMLHTPCLSAAVHPRWCRNPSDSGCGRVLTVTFQKTLTLSAQVVGNGPNGLSWGLVGMNQDKWALLISEMLFMAMNTKENLALVLHWFDVIPLESDLIRPKV